MLRESTLNTDGGSMAKYSHKATLVDRLVSGQHNICDKFKVFRWVSISMMFASDNGEASSFIIMYNISHHNWLWMHDRVFVAYSAAP